MERITSKENAYVKHVKKLSASASYRRETGEFAAEGEKLLSEALRSGIAVSGVFFDEKKGISEELVKILPESCRLVETSAQVISSLSDTETAQGVVFCAKIPAHTGAIPVTGGVLLLEDIRDPGNLGTILRTADAFSAAGVLLLGNPVDLWSPKVIRAAMGASFRVKVNPCTPETLRQMLGDRPIYAATLSEQSKSIAETALSCAAVIIGNEARGVSPQLVAMADGQIKIPMTGQAESLNAAVAAAIVLWEMNKY